MGGSSTELQYIASAAADTIAPVAPTRTAPEAMPSNAGQAQFSGGVKKTDSERVTAGKGSSRLVIPLADDLSATDGNTQAGGTTTAPTASTTVGG